MGSASRRDVHYEVQTRDRSGWVVLDLSHDKDQALDAANQAWQTGRHKAIRVVKESYDPSENTYKSLEIAHHGRHSGNCRGERQSAATCRKVADLYTAEARRTIHSLLGDILGEWQITPTELLHSPAHYHRLANVGTILQAAVQRAAIGQTLDEGESLQRRMNLLYELGARAAQQLKSARDAGLVPTLSRTNADKIIATLDADESRRSLLFTAALTEHLRLASDGRSKLGEVLAIVRHGHPTWAVRSADFLVSELLPQKEVAETLVGVGSNLGVTLRALAGLAVPPRETRSLPPTGANDSSRIRKFILEGQMPRTRGAILAFIAGKLASSERLTGGDLKMELTALDELGKALGDALEEMVGATTLGGAIKSRCTRFLNPEFIRNYLAETPEPDDAIARLFELTANCCGAENSRRLGDHIIPLLKSDGYIEYFTNPKGNPLERMRKLARLQRAAAGVGLDPEHKRDISSGLDELCARTMERVGLLDLLEKRVGGHLEAVKRLLAMINSQCFTEGRAMTLATDRLRVYLRSPEIVRLTASASGEASLDEVRDLLTALTGSADSSLAIND